jgi:hypothetical protein
MRKRCRTSWRRSTRGITLVEALLGTAILGSLLVSVLLAASRLHVQAARAEARITACRIADGLLEAWWPKPDAFPRRGQGAVAGREGWSWRTEVVENTAARTVKAEVVALEIFAAGADRGTPMARVEVMLPERSDAREAGVDAR